MEGKKSFLLLALTLGLVFLLCNVFVQSRMDAIIKQNKLVNEQFIEGAPPLVAFTTIALGGFRGIIADMLWLRSISLQDEGKYFEMVQLASWITKLQPKFTGAIAYLAWNMSYNISVTFSSPEDRWRWVNNGINLYHEALKYNPNDPMLYKELGWIYQHKLGNVLDDAQRYYKYQMAKDMLAVFGARKPDWEAFAAAPANEAALRVIYKEDSYLWTALKESGFENIAALSAVFREKGGVLPETFRKKLNNAKDEKLIENCLRASWLRDVYFIDPAVVLSINRKYGELDWFLPESYAIYWATMGINKSPGKADTDCDRMISQSLQVAFANGWMMIPNNQPTMDFLIIPNMAVVDSVRDFYRDAAERNKNVASFRHALENFLSAATVTLYSYGQYSKAQEYYRDLRKSYPGNKAAKLDFDQYVLSVWSEDISEGGYKQAQELISGLIFRACILIGYGDREAALSHIKLAQLAYEKYTRTYKENRVKLPSFDKMKSEVALACIRNYPTLGENIRAFALAESAQKEAPENQPDTEKK